MIANLALNTVQKNATVQYCISLPKQGITKLEFSVFNALKMWHCRRMFYLLYA
jgi:hypothetical protein